MKFSTKSINAYRQKSYFTTFQQSMSFETLYYKLPELCKNKSSISEMSLGKQ